ncbi:hypothetical protein [Bacillus atrophaeus]|uniref:hypothetical protein n=1 Tax=Bacillus atrophaeus TaxID=1452 RepID=UPI00123AFAE9|nr:hypothetical protein [Bacillus atrophaeus]KAA6455262.1 hypothetical protein DX926_04305 [Bacillus atrophaeus]MEC2307799.1 hypothetical protein [Bacillus atrophaeus]
MNENQKKTTPAATEVDPNKLLNLFKPISKFEIMLAVKNTHEFLEWAHQNEWTDQQIHQVVKIIHSLLEN